MISVFDKKENCCGCTACQHVCPTEAIIMEPDEEGFLYPKINQESCVDCGLCKKACVFQKGYDISRNLDTPLVYAVKHKNEGVRMSSASGGAFTAISDYILDQGGVVYGVAFDDEMNVVHQYASTKKERDKFKGSKYVQSKLGNTFSDIRSLLEKQYLVLFTGTPCQTAGLRNYLYLNDVDTEKLILCDILCHGTPSPLMWREHISHLEKKEGSKIAEYYCRSKIKGWHGHNEMAVYQNGKTDYQSILSQKHKVLFYSHCILRPSCYYCKFTNLQRPSDITIADFWGIEQCMPDFDDNKGISLVLINSSKGQDLFKNISNIIMYRESNVKDCLQPRLQYPAKPSAKRDQFWEDYFMNGYNYVVKKYAGYNLKSRTKSFVKKTLLKTGLLETAKKILR